MATFIQFGHKWSRIYDLQLANADFFILYMSFWVQGLLKFLPGINAPFQGDNEQSAAFSSLICFLQRILLWLLKNKYILVLLYKQKGENYICFDRFTMFILVKF